MTETHPAGYLVVGPESSGTRFVTRLLIGAGCKGDPDHLQSFDQKLPKAEVQPIVWRRSFPHALKWPIVSDLCKIIENAGYRPIVLVTVRHPWILVHSQRANGHVDSVEQSEKNIEMAYKRIFMTIGPNEFHVVAYESLVREGQAVRRFLQAIGMGNYKPENLPVITDGNSKYYAKMA